MNSLWRAAVSCAVVHADSLPAAGTVPGEHLGLRTATHSRKNHQVLYSCGAEGRRVRRYVA